jgi:hypothetical protein
MATRFSNTQLVLQYSSTNLDHFILNNTENMSTSKTIHEETMHIPENKRDNGTEL